MAAVAIAVIVATMVLLDAWSVRQARGLPADLLTAARRFTDLGKAGWFLWPLGILLLALVAIYSPAMPRFSRGVLAAWAVRIGFVFTAIAVPGLFVTIVKRHDRAGPAVRVAGPDVWAYEPFSWHARYASFPSGHATTAFAALVAIGAIFPQARALMWIYAVLIALSRVMITAHHPSDVIAGAIVGAVGAVMVRNWFAARRLGFAVAADGSVQADARPELAADHQSGCPPPALCLEGGMSVDTTNAPAVSVIVPVRNEAENVAPLVAEIAAALAGRSFEVIYVNDGSTDGTEAELVRLKAQHPWLRQIRHARSCGQSAALRTGMWAARGTVIVTLDGDGQNDPAFLPQLIAKLEQGAPRMGLVAGQRVGRKATAFKRFQSRFANAVRGAILRDGTRD